MRQISFDGKGGRGEGSECGDAISKTVLVMTPGVECRVT